MSEKIRVLIADDHAIVRQGFKQIFSETEDLVVAGEADDGVDALLLARQNGWDVFLLDISMPNRNGIDTLKQLKREFPRLHLKALTMVELDFFARFYKMADEEVIERLKAAGMDSWPSWRSPRWWPSRWSRSERARSRSRRSPRWG